MTVVLKKKFCGWIIIERKIAVASSCQIEFYLLLNYIENYYWGENFRISELLSCLFHWPQKKISITLQVQVFFEFTAVIIKKKGIMFL